MHHSPPGPRPTATGARALAPDAARGFALLFIAIANLTVYLYGRDQGILFRPVDAGLGDRVADVLGALFIDNRSFPLFSLLFAYGLHQLVTREEALGTAWPVVRRLLVRRNAWLFVFGALHGLLLFMGDIMHTYALAGFVLILLMRSPNWVLWLVFGITAPLAVAFGSGDGAAASGLAAVGGAADPMMPSAVSATLLDAQLARAGEFLPLLAFAPFTVLGVLPPMMLGLLMARSQLLERPWQHARAVRSIAIGGVSAAILGGLPFAFGLALGFEPGPVWFLAGSLHAATGILAGAGYAALFALIVAGTQRSGSRPGPVIGALTALGRRSMSGYLAQSVIFFAIMPAWSMGLGATVGTGGALLVGTGTWLATLLGAVLLERMGKPGPAEWAIRRLSYGRPPARAVVR
ncbi:DUF418 domain-containing protein [Pseudoclavibacter sp. JSM 162008]|uniref:DUF418 domain-containing protein n=1 Tax=Pseudoclavibacter sp. JSM 162008 TaxID=3229855 RepID=UPI0035237117